MMINTISNEKIFILRLQAEMLKEVVEWDQNTDEHFKDLINQSAAYVGWIKNSTFDIIYLESREHIKQKTIYIPIDFEGIDPNSKDVVDNIKARIRHFNWQEFLTNNEELSSTINCDINQINRDIFIPVKSTIQKDYTVAIEKTIAFFADIIQDSNETPRKILVRMNERRIAKGESPVPHEQMPESDIKYFSDAMRVHLTQHFNNYDIASLQMNYQPQWLLADIISKSEIVDKKHFLYLARFPSKMRVDIAFDHVSLFLNGDSMPKIWLFEERLNQPLNDLQGKTHEKIK